MRIWKANQGIQRKNRSIVFESVGNYTSLPPRSFKNGSVNILFKEPDPDSGAFGYQPSLARATPMSGITSTQSFVTANEYPPSPNTTSSTPAPFLLASQPASPVERKFHLPFRPSLASPGVPPMDSLVEDYRRAAPKEGREEDSSDVSSTLPVFASSETSTKHTVMQNAGRGAMRSLREKSNGGESDVSEIVWAHQSVDNSEPRAVVSRTSMRDDASGVLGETMSGRRYMTPMARISQPSECQSNCPPGGIFLLGFRLARGKRSSQSTQPCPCYLENNIVSDVSTIYMDVEDATDLAFQSFLCCTGFNMHLHYH